MKIYIGKYKYWFGPFHLAEKILFWKDQDDTAVWKLGNKLGDIQWLTKLLEWIESKRKRKIKIHIDKYDTWNMDDTLAMIILPMLKQLKETKHGAPHVQNKDVPKGLRSSNPKDAYTHDIDENHFKRWDWVLDEMIFAFECKRDDTIEHEILFSKPLEKDGSLNKKGLKEYNKHKKRVDNGLRLFGKYYNSLWD